MEDVALTINGKRVSCPPGTSILEAAEEQGIKIPRLCYHPDLEPFGACRLCLVEDEKSGRVMASCVTPVAPDMAVKTDSPRVIKHRINIVRLMMAEHPESCVVCAKGNQCQLRQIAAQLGIAQTDLYPMPNYKPLEQANPFIIRDLSKCILCGKCIRADHELVVVGAIDYNLRGFKSYPATIYDMALEDTGCTFCGTCISICPTGALTAKNTRYVGTPMHESLSICGFCGVGCSLAMGMTDDKIIETNPSNLQNSVNGSTLCVRGHFAHDFLNAEERLTKPMIRKDNQFICVSWDEALDFTANRLVDIRKKYGPQSVGLFGSSKCTNEENYLFQKMARVILGTNNLDNGGYLAGRPVLSLIDERTEGGCRINPLASLEKAEAIFVLGANPGQSVPVVSYYLKRAAKKGIPLIIADPRKTDLVPFSSLWLPIFPHRDLELINSLAALLWKKFAHDSNFIERFTNGFDRYRGDLFSFNPERLCLMAGVGMTAVEKAVDLLKFRKIAFVVGQGILQQKNGTQSMEALLNLLMMTGSLGSEGGGLYVIARENNQIGAWDMGTVPDELPGRQSLGSETARKKWEQAWKAKLSPDQGLNIINMIEEAEKDNLKALYVMGENPLRSLPQPERIRKAFANLDLLVVQDILLTETSRIADVVLPGAAFSEKDGSFTNMEGRIQNFGPVVPPPGDARPDWEILDILAEKMGYPGRYGSLEKIRAEIARLIPLYRDLNGQGDVAWVKETSGRKLFQPAGEGTLIPFSPVVLPEDEVPDAGYPFTAILGSLRYHLGSGTRTGHSNRIRDFGLKVEVEISPEDGEKVNLRNGDTVLVQSRYGSLVREIRLDSGIRPGLIFVPTGFNGNQARNLIELTPLGEAHSPGWKTCRVKLEKLPDNG